MDGLRRLVGRLESLASFARYVCYSQLHCLWLTTKAVVTGEAVTLDVTRPLTDALHAEFYRTADSELPALGRVMYLCNHRSWADFIVDSVLTNGGSYLARWAVFFGVPMACLYGWVSGSVMFFRRRRGLDRVAFTRFIKESWDYRRSKPLIVYPEGTRNRLNTSRALKTGAIQAAYDLNVPVQVLITTNKEHLINERSLRVGRHVKLVSAYSELLYPSEHADQAAWLAAVQARWDDTWARAYQCKDPVPFDGVFLDTISHGVAEPVVARRAWALRIIFGAAGVAYVGNAILKRLH